MARQQKPLPPPKRCVYCGALATSRDHVIPSSLFTPPLPQMITVPACADCQTEKSYGDDDLAHYVAFSWAGSQHPRAHEQLEPARRATLIGHSKLGKAFLEGGSIRELSTDSGIYLFDVWEVPIPDENRDMFKTLEYIIRGLHVVRNFRFDRKIDPIPPDCPVDVRALNRLKAEPTITKFLRLPHEDFVVMRNSPATNEQPIAMWSRTVPKDSSTMIRTFSSSLSSRFMRALVPSAAASSILAVAAVGATMAAEWPHLWRLPAPNGTK